MSVTLYRIRHMFNGTIQKDEDTREVVFFTRDNEHLLAQLVEPSLDEAVAKGWVEATEVPTMRDLREKQKEVRAAAREEKKKGGSAK